MNKPLAFAALAEAATGVALIVVPSLVVRLLLGTELSGVAVAVGRVAGISLLSLGVACWPGKEPTRSGARWDGDLRPARYALPLVPRHSRRVGGPTLVAGRGVARRADVAAGTRVVQCKKCCSETANRKRYASRNDHAVKPTGTKARDGTSRPGRARRESSAV